MDIKFIEKFYKKVIFNDFSAAGADYYKNTKEVKLEQLDPEDDNYDLNSYELHDRLAYVKSPKKQTKKEIVETTVAPKKTGAKRGRKKKNYVPEPQE